MRTVFWFIYFFVSLFLLIPCQLYIAVLKKTGKTEKAEAKVNKFARWWMNSLLKLAGAKITITGQENLPAGPAVYLSNHQGNFDIPLLLVHLGKAHGFIAKKEIEKIPLIGQWVKWIHCICLDRESNQSAIATFQQTVHQLKDGHSIIIFPEGTRGRGGPMNPFKEGAVTIAKKAGVPVVPLCINGTYKAMEANGGWIKPAAYSLTILPPVDLAALSRGELKELTGVLQTQIEEILTAQNAETK